MTAIIALQIIAFRVRERARAKVQVAYFVMIIHVD